MNEPAFPVAFKWGEDFKEYNGMTLRDYFAAKALPAILEQMDVCNGKELTNAAWISYQMADAMMEARNAAQ